MINSLTLKLSSFIDLSDDDRAELDLLARQPAQRRAPSDLIKDGERPEHVFLLLEGWAYRYKILSDGSRQIMAFLIPGDLCDAHIFILDRREHSVGLLSDASVAAIPKQLMCDVTERRPRIAQALWWSTLVDEAVLRHWLVNIRQRDAYDRIAHLFCEMWERMNQVGLTNEGGLDLPLPQEQLGNTVGLTSVHTNRMLQRMRAEGLISIRGKRLTIHDMDRMRRVAQYNPDYLHLRRRQYIPNTRYVRSTSDRVTLTR